MQNTKEDRATEASFSNSPIPEAQDAHALDEWDGRDPLDVVLPLSVMSAWAYSSPNDFERVMRRRGLLTQDPVFVEVVNDAMFVCAKAYVQEVQSGVVVAFRGTEPTNLLNWLADATLERVAFHVKPQGRPRGHVHGGFYRNIRAIWPEVVEQLAAMDPEWICFTGHSYGGALAVLAAALLADYSEDKPTSFGKLWSKLRGVVTFGQPMVGDSVFASTYTPTVGPKLARFVYASDIVPHLPPRTSGWTPMAFGTEYRSADSSGWARARQSSRAATSGIVANAVALAAWMKDQTGLALQHRLPYSWADHAPNNYVRVSLPDDADSGSEFD